MKKNILSFLLFIAAFSINPIQAHHHHHSDDDKDNPPCNHESLEDARRALEDN